MTLMSNVVKILDKITGPVLKFQSVATLGSFTTDGGIGDGVTSDKKYSVIVERKQRQVSTGNGLFTTSTTTVLFFGSVDVKPNDMITLADGSGGVVVGVGSPVDASGRLITEAYLG